MATLHHFQAVPLPIAGQYVVIELPEQPTTIIQVRFLCRAFGSAAVIVSVGQLSDVRTLEKAHFTKRQADALCAAFNTL